MSNIHEDHETLSECECGEVRGGLYGVGPRCGKMQPQWEMHRVRFVHRALRDLVSDRASWNRMSTEVGITKECLEEFYGEPWFES